MEKNLKQERSAIIKVAMFGPESTGKTTLAIQLADHFKSAWVPEFARDYLQDKWNNQQLTCDVNDMLPIAYGQTKLENDTLSIANKFLFCDTNLMVTKVFSEVYYGSCDTALDEAAREHEYDLFFLTDVDVPWEKDDLRDKPDGRKSVFNVFKKALIENKKPFIILSGDKNLRLKSAITIIEDLAIAKEIGLSSFDFVHAYEYGIPMDNIRKQLAIFRNGVAKTVLLEPATLYNGILKLSENEYVEKANYFDVNKSTLNLQKFVPASGAASRMFKFLVTFMNDFDADNESINSYLNKTKESDLPVFIVGLERFPFFEEIDQKLKEEFVSFDSLHRNLKNYYFIQLMLSEDYFNYANKPKGVLPFHKYETHSATAIEEHLYECVNYSSSKGVSNLHFTVSESHLKQFEDIVNTVKPIVEKETQTVINVNYSFQKKSTDTIAVNLNNEPFRNEKEELVFRPGGHGALIQNLNELEADIVFIKNIDNVAQSNQEKITVYKKALAGILIELQQKIFFYLKAIDSGTFNQEALEESILFLREKLNITGTSEIHNLSFEEGVELVKTSLDRPIRICGMVKNEGEPGGGPFWTKSKNGKISLQIVESSEVDLLLNEQETVLKEASHFNPVDLVCGIRNFKNEKFDLMQYVDQDRGFIVNKSVSGIDIKGYELPGLWNGAMANWLTVFVEVPLITFNPVKTVNDLLSQAHQPD